MKMLSEGDKLLCIQSTADGKIESGELAELKTVLPGNWYLVEAKVRDSKTHVHLIVMSKDEVAQTFKIAS